ncbi:MAG: hypothetical protein Q4Q20_05950 [Methanocorpusculum sp.]|nr:hypothetical protein [Methanocorpusculum sp.]
MSSDAEPVAVYVIFLNVNPKCEILRTPAEVLFVVKDASLPLPAPAVMQDSVVCPV